MVVRPPVWESTSWSNFQLLAFWPMEISGRLEIPIFETTELLAVFVLIAKTFFSSTKLVFDRSFFKMR